MGESGLEMNRILAQAGLKRDSILCTNVIAAQPQSNETWRFFEPKSTARSRIGGLAPSELVRSHVSVLYRQISAFPRSLVIVAGNYALWSLTNCTGAEVIRESNFRAIPPELQTWGPTGIMSWRGSMLYTDARPEFGTVPRTPLLPIIHPAAILRAWYLRDVTIHDLRSRIPMALRGDWRPEDPVLLAPPTFEVARNLLRSWLRHAEETMSQMTLSVDIETNRTLITCIGLASSSRLAISIPFVRKTDDGLESYWTPVEEAELIWLLRSVLTHPLIRIVGQNFVYDTQYIQRFLGVTPDLWFDTMLAQNVIFPGTPKDLGYLASLYCQYYWYWKDDAKEWDGKGTLEQLLQYNAMDCIRTWEIAESQQQYIRHLGLEPQMDLKMQTSKLCLRMMNRGVLIDRRRRDQLLFELSEALSRLHQELLGIIPQSWIKPHTKPNETFWFTSDKQTKQLFYDFLGFRVIRHRKTGNPTTGKEALMQFKKLYPQFSGLINRLDLAGSIENTLNVLKAGIEFDGRMRCSYNPGGTETHRLSSSTNAFGRGTNFQNLTKGEEDD